jgi:hypothetical protein
MAESILKNTKQRIKELTTDFTVRTDGNSLIGEIVGIRGPFRFRDTSETGQRLSPNQAHFSAWPGEIFHLHRD